MGRREYACLCAYVWRSVPKMALTMLLSMPYQVVELGRQDSAAVVDGVLALIAKLPVDVKGSVVAALRRGVIFADPFSGETSTYVGVRVAVARERNCHCSPSLL